jgi:hypothetical protein
LKFGSGALVVCDSAKLGLIIHDAGYWPYLDGVDVEKLGIKPLMKESNNLIVVLAGIGDNLAYNDGLHFCEEVYPYRNRKKV